MARSVQVNAATSATTAAALDAALALTRACSDLPIFLNALKKQGSAIELATLCSDRLSDAALSDLCWLLHNASVFDDGILTALSTDPTLGKRLVHLWYSRKGTTRQRVEALLNKIMATQEGPEQLSAGMEEGQVLKFVEDLRAKRQIDVAAATGGANILHPSKYEPSGAPRAEDTLVEDSQREQDLAKVGASQSCLVFLFSKCFPTRVLPWEEGGCCVRKAEGGGCDTRSPPLLRRWLPERGSRHTQARGMSLTGTSRQPSAYTDDCSILLRTRRLSSVR